jgi:hypothetical protein
MSLNDSFQCEVENATYDDFGNKITMIKCRGRLVNDSALQLKNVVKPLIPTGGRIILDLASLNDLDSSGRAARFARRVYDHCCKSHYRERG